tara:strand:+ start:13643 stop:15034 length:1392 start_codon:yes stop_codon:yes gene_type:complete
MSSLHSEQPNSLWLDTLDPPITRRSPLDGDLSVDVAIVGGGFSGLWTAYYLLASDPNLNVLVIESEYCGFGASGRNGGWCEGALAGGAEKYAAKSSKNEAQRLERAMFDAVDEVERITHKEGISCGFIKSGVISVARNQPQAQRQRDEIKSARENGFGEDVIRFLERDEALTYLNATKVLSGIFFAPSATIDPARLVRGLAIAVEKLGGQIVESTKALNISKNEVMTDYGLVKSEVIVQATEAYTRNLKGHKLDLLPVYSRMIATEPLGEKVFEEIGLKNRPTFADGRYMVIYGQRTEDNRIAFGGQGMPPYLFGSEIRKTAEVNKKSHELIHQTLIDLLPPLRDFKITHRWGGVLAIPRNWLPGLRFDRFSGLGVLGGYVGEGVAAANLAGRTMAELILRHDTERVTLPWVGVRSRRWEPEPLRWLGVRASRRLMGSADISETRTNKTSKSAMLIAHLLRGD